MKTTFNGRRPRMEDDLKIWKFEYLSSHWSDLPQILNISLWDQTKVKIGLNEDNLQWKTTSNGRWPQNMKIWISQQPLNMWLLMISTSQSVRRVLAAESADCFRKKKLKKSEWPPSATFTSMGIASLALRVSRPTPQWLATASPARTRGAPSVTQGCARTSPCTADACLRRGAPTFTTASTGASNQPSTRTMRSSRKCLSWWKRWRPCGSR